MTIEIFQSFEISNDSKFEICNTSIHNVFHVSLLRGWLTNGVHANVPSIKIDGKAEYKVAEIKDHHEQQGEMQYLTLFVSFDSSEDMWLSTAQLDHAPVLL